jgi:DNA-binding transcriptional LysR family regulator
MELRQLRYFLVVGEEEHFGRAAERLHVTQSAVSQVTRALEHELGVALFDRVGRGVRLTTAGRTLHEVAQRLFDDLGNSIELVKRSARGEVGRLRVGHSGFASWDPIMVETLKRFRAAQPQVSIELQEMNTWQQSRALEAGRIDAGFQYPVTREPGLEYSQIRLARRAIAFPRNHPKLRKRSTLQLADLADESFVILPRAMQGPGYDTVMSACLAAGFEPRIVQEADSATTLLNLVLGGVGITFLTSSGAERLPAGVVVRHVRGLDLWQRFSLAWRRKGPANPALYHFVASARSLIPDARGARAAK